MRGPRTAVIAHKTLDSERMPRKGKTETKTAKEKRTKDSDAPKRPPSAFFVFMEEFRKSFKENFPDNKSASAVSKAGGEKWKSMSDCEKAPYIDKAAKKKAEYAIAVDVYNRKKNDDKENSTGSSNSTSEVNNEPMGESSSS